MDGQRFRYGFPGFYGCRPFGELVVTFIEYRIFRVVFGVVGGRERRVDAKCHLDILFCRGDQHGGEFAVELCNGLFKSYVVVARRFGYVDVCCVVERVTVFIIRFTPGQQDKGSRYKIQICSSQFHKAHYLGFAGFSRPMACLTGICSLSSTRCSPGWHRH